MASGVTKGRLWVVVMRVLAWGLFALVACTSSAPQGDAFTPGTGGFAQRCERSEDCASGLCVRLDAKSGICSNACTKTGDCPAANNWACLPAGSVGLEVCACRLLGTSESCGDGADNDCNGHVDDCRMCGGRLAPDDDPQNCGSCGTVCSSGHVCRDAKCQCPSDELECGGDCVDTRSNARHCGDCNQACSSAQICQNGKCKCPDAKAGDYCDGVGCVDLATNAANCGTCGTVCAPGTECRNGACTCPNREWPDYCPGIGCIALEREVSHCGACDVSCQLGQRCIEGECACPTTSPEFCEGVGCVDFTTDRYNCGACSNTCPTSQICSAGKCVCGVSSAPDFCGDSGCVDLKTDAKNCGACGRACTGEEVCVQGSCQCPAGKVLCAGACIDPKADPKNCGECGKTCGSAQACISGMCGCSAAGYATCGDQCVVTSSDPNHCGSCDVVCGANEVCFNGRCECWSGPVCNGVCTRGDGTDNCGACGVTCPSNQYCSGSCQCLGAGLTACGSQCADLLTDVGNCGECGRACPRGQECLYGSCGCVRGQTYCEASAACVALDSDEAHCGGCQKACKATEICQQGQCACANWNQSFCAETGACTSIIDNDAHCGACGNACPSGTHCSYNTCVCDQAGQSLCGNDCYDLSRDTQHCGACDKACDTPLTCAGGGCSCPLPSIGPATRITTNAGDDIRPSLAWDGTHAGLAYVRTAADGSGELRVALLNADASVATDVLVAAFDSAHSVIDAPSLTWTGSEYGLAWLQRRQDNARFDVEFQRFSATLVPEGSALSVGDGADALEAYSVSLAFGTGGYAIAYADTSRQSLQDRLRFRKLGSDGTATGTANVVSLYATFAPASVSLAIASDGSCAAAAGYPYGIIIGFFNADGSRTAAPLELIDDTSSASPRPSMIHSGSDWLLAFSAGSAGNLALNQGATEAYTPFVNANGNPIRASVITVKDGLLSVVYTQPPNSTSGDLIRFQRFKLPTTGSPYLTALHAPVDVLSTQNYSSSGGFATIPIGPRRSLVTWSDNRWGDARELYAVVVDAGMCP